MEFAEYNEQHSFDVADAKKYGIDKAIILKNLRFWLRKNFANRRNIRDGKIWSYQSAKAWARQFPYLSPRKIARLLRELEECGAIESAVLNSKKYDRTKWYTIPSIIVVNDTAIIENEPPVNTGPDKDNCLGSPENTDCPKVNNGVSHFVQPIPSLNKSLKRKDISSSGDEQDAENKTLNRLTKNQIDQMFEDMWKQYHKKQNKQPAKERYKKLIKEEKINDIGALTEFNEKIIKSWQWRNEENSFGFDKKLLQNYLKDRQWDDEPPTSKQASDTLNELKVAEHLPNAMSQFLNDTWTKLLHVPNFEKAVIERAIAQKLIKKPENLEKLYQFGFKPRG
jgi:hypothetical protein